MRWFVVMLLTVLPVPAVAQDCDEAETTLEMGVCLQDALAAADAELNLTYRLAMEALEDFDDPGIAASLKQAQRAWITYRDLACASERALYAGGSMAGIARTGCLLRLTTERVTGLSEFLPY